MLSTKSSTRRLLTALAATGCLLAGFSTLTQAQNLPGLTIFSGVERQNQLSYFLDFGGQSDNWDRYRLKIPGKKMELGAAQFIVSYPDYYKGKFDTKSMEVRVKGKKFPIREVNWDKENHKVMIYMEEPVPAGNNVELVFSNVKNPPFGGVYYFNAAILTPGDVPLPRYLGTWILSIN